MKASEEVGSELRLSSERELVGHELLAIPGPSVGIQLGLQKDQ